MVNKGFLNTFIAVLAATLFFYGVTTFGTIAFGNALTKEFGDQTYAGPFEYFGGKRSRGSRDAQIRFHRISIGFCSRSGISGCGCGIAIRIGVI